MIYLKLCGRIGNQIFMYACARMIQVLKGDNDVIVIEDCANDRMKYENSLVYYDLPNVEYVHSMDLFNSREFSTHRHVCTFLDLVERRHCYENVSRIESFFYPLFVRKGVIRLQDGYRPLPTNFETNVYLQGYFQSEKFFEPIKDEIIERFRIEEELEKSGYPNLELIQSRNTVCISIKVQHNVGNPMYDVCNMDYYKRAIEKVVAKVENPLFMICSDDVDYVKEKLIDCSKYECVSQSKDFPVYLSLAAMAQCKHFIIGNTSFGWWAQYLSTYSEKVVIAPSRWYGIDLPRDIYQDTWELIEV